MRILSHWYGIWIVPSLVHNLHNILIFCAISSWIISPPFQISLSIPLLSMFLNRIDVLHGSCDELFTWTPGVIWYIFEWGTSAFLFQRFHWLLNEETISPLLDVNKYLKLVQLYKYGSTKPFDVCFIKGKKAEQD
jgi:hypothetical protein